MMKQYKEKLTTKLHATLKIKKQKHTNFLIGIIFTNIIWTILKITVCNTGIDFVQYKGFYWSLLGPKLKK